MRPVAPLAIASFAAAFPLAVAAGCGSSSTSSSGSPAGNGTPAAGIDGGHDSGTTATNPVTTPMTCSGTCASCAPAECPCQDGTTQSDCACSADSNGVADCIDSSECAGLHVCDAHGGNVATSTTPGTGTGTDSGAAPVDSGFSTPMDSGPSTQCPYFSTLGEGCGNAGCIDSLGPNAMAASDPVFCTKDCDPNGSGFPCGTAYSCIPTGAAGSTDGECLLGCQSDQDCTAAGFKTCTTSSANPSMYCTP